MADSTVARSRRKAAKKKHPKPHKDFPLFPHDRGYWAKKVRGKLAYFGRIADDPKGVAALEQWRNEKDDLLAGRKPRKDGEGLTVEDLCDHFLNAKKPLVASGELSQRMYDEYFATCKRMVKDFGMKRLVEDLRPEDFTAFRESASKKWGLHRLAGEVQRVRTVFKFGVDQDLIKHVVKFGQMFKKPRKDVFRRAKEAKGPSMFEAHEIRQLLTKAGTPLDAMILLAINAGYGNADCGQLPRRAVDLEKGWVTFRRGKTGIKRRCPLWPETIAALKTAIAKRPKPKDPADEHLVFVTKYGHSWFTDTPDNPVSWQFRKLLNSEKLHTHGKGFYWLRHTFATVAGESKDQVAVNHIMGHTDPTMAGEYRERIDDERLKAVTDYVRSWLFGDVEGGEA